ncbi:MAG: DUF599 domain-containing protein [Betaproteobacteria bacterium]|nr:DUF599 domain-containing protein [Betaproteobacteria bacterium]
MLTLITAYHGELLGFVLSFGMIAAYHLYLHWYLMRHDPHYTVQAIQAEARRHWVESVMRDKRDIMAVQTLRNSTMAATFLASTAVLLIMGTLSMSEHGGDMAHALHALNILGAVDPSLWLLKLLALVIDLFVAFFAFTLAIRKFNHVGYLLNIPAELHHPIITPQYVADYLNRAARYYSTGMRAYYFTVPLLFWLFGPHLMVLSSLVLVFVLHRLDRAPDSGD